MPSSSAPVVFGSCNEPKGIPEISIGAQVLAMFPRHRITYTVRFLMLRLILLRSSEKRMMDECSMSISSSVHFLHGEGTRDRERERERGHKSTKALRLASPDPRSGHTYPDGDSALGCSCMVRSPSLLNACPAAVNISPT